MDEIQARIGLRPTPLTWPVGIGPGDFKGCFTGRTEASIPVHSAPRAAPQRATRRAPSRRRCARCRRDEGITPSRESELLSADGSDYDREQFLRRRGHTRCCHLGALNSGVINSSMCRRTRASAPRSTRMSAGPGAPPNHVQRYRFQGAGRPGLRPPRCIAYARVCSGTFERGMSSPRRYRKAVVTKYASRCLASIAPPGTPTGRVM